MKYTEKLIQDKLSRRYPYASKEVWTPAGKIDILTPSLLIEVKIWGQWKQAIGQVICYGTYYPDRQKHIHFFGHCSRETKFEVQIECQKHGINISWE